MEFTIIDVQDCSIVPALLHTHTKFGCSQTPPYTTTQLFYPLEAPVYLLHFTYTLTLVVSCGSQFFSCSVVVLLLATCYSLILQLQLVGQTGQARMGEREFSDTNFEIGKTLQMFQLNVSVIIRVKVKNCVKTSSYFHTPVRVRRWKSSKVERER